MIALVAALTVAATLTGGVRVTSAFQAPASKQDGSAPPASPSIAEIDKGSAALRASRPEAALAHFQRAVDLARVENDRLSEGRAHRGTGVALRALARYPQAKIETEEAIRLLSGLSKPHLANALFDLGVVHFYLNDAPAALQHYSSALALFEELGDVRQQANLYHSMSLSAATAADQIAFLEKGLPLAQQAGDAGLTASLFHSWSDALFQQGRYADAMEKIGLAIAGFEAQEEAGRYGLAVALTSLGRLYRVHGQHERALESYRRAYRLQELRNDRYGMIQSLNAMSIASAYLNRESDERNYLERAVALARTTGSSRSIGLAAGNLGDFLIRSGEIARGVALLEEVVGLGYPLTYQNVSLAEGYISLRQYSRAIEAADRAASYARATGFEELLYRAFTKLAYARDKLGETTHALADAREAVALIERGRAAAVPTDSMKRGYASQYDSIFSLNIDLLYKLGQHREALEVAERARARAFADLLASRGNTRSSPVAGHPETAPAPGRPSEPDSLLRSRGAIDPTTSGAKLPSDDLPSSASVEPLSSTELSLLAARLDSTIVSYWVGAEATYVWVIKGSGDVDTVRVDAGEARLRDLVRRARSIKVGQASRSEAMDVRTDPAADEPDTAWTPRLRGAGLLSLGDDAIVASRSLYDLLVQPIERLLPARRGSLLTIVPHGPLFLLSFAALPTASGQYLLERHAIHYAPAGVVLKMTERQKVAGAARRLDYLLVGDPASPPPLDRGKPLPRLPGTATEVKEIAGSVQGAAIRRLVGADATEEAVRRLAGSSTVIHFATHGVVNAGDPLDSFLALHAGKAATPISSGDSSGPGGVAAARRDGRLTVREIYDLRLAADLVVLSACETAVGKISGDGVAGLARAFVYAGTPSVVATLWDIADEPAARLMPYFYRTLRREHDTAGALRSAQLRLLSDLRAGRVSVATPSGPVVLREHPILWAGFMLFGER